MLTLTSLFAVGSGGFIGAILRYVLSVLAQLRGIPSFYATISINILGSLAIAFFTTRILSPDSSSDLSSPMSLFLRVGICGGFTTFSTFSFEALDMLQHGRTAEGIMYITASCLCCILAAAAGVRLASL